ncbi:prorelaxin H1 [Odontesthes bonariensis]|uniref:prorelaxin H1 n=1 Tax=Odontesthes bonariensis TaxID=219752 RepID=UPI003F58107D
MLWRVSLAVAVVCIGGICNCVRADVMSRLMVPRDYGVKLCGREFIRAVIFTCGGSRWKRSIDGDLDPLLWNSFGDVTAEDDEQTLNRGEELTDNRPPLPGAPSYSLADLLTLYRATSGRQQPSLRVPALMGESTDLGEQEGNRDVANWPVPSKKKRNFSLGVAGMCCSQGCTKNDIGRLC